MKQLVERFQAKLAEAQALNKPDMTAEDAQKITALNGELKSLKSSIEAAKETAQMASFLTVGDYLPSGQQNAQVLGVKSAGAADINVSENGIEVEYNDNDTSIAAKQSKLVKTVEYRRAFKTWLRSGGNEMRMSLDNMKFLQEGVDQSGGFLVPEDMLNRIVQKKPAPTSFLGKCTMLQTSRDALAIPRVVYNTDDIYTTGIRVTKTGETPASDTTAQVTDPVFGSFRIPVQTWMLSLPITNDMIEDSSFPLEAWVSSKFSETIQLLMENQGLNGSGVGENLGIVTAIARGATGDPAYIANGSTSALSADKLIQVNNSLPPQYDDAPGVCWLMEKTGTKTAVMQLKDAQNRYLFFMGGASDGGLQNGGTRVDTLLGDKLLCAQFMPSLSSGNIPILFGDFSGYYYVNRIGFTLQVLREVGARQNQVILVGRVRFGGQPVENWKMKGLKYSVS
jgi:HK97 family phage major capsid protein